MKRVGHLKEQITDIDNLYLAYHKACRGKHNKSEVKNFAEDFDRQISIIKEELDDGSFVFGDYHYFKIFDPKERLICAAPLRERIVQHVIMNICHQYFDKRLINSTCATRKGKGVYVALDFAKKAMEKCKYSVKLDVRKYYDSISHTVLKEQLRHIFKDRWLLDLFDKIIDSYEVKPGKGLPIGNLTSQYFANLYLASVDYRVKEYWKIKHYVRYMDDMLVASDDLIELKKCVRDLERYMASELLLTLKAPVYSVFKRGQVFLGYRVLPYRLKLSGRSKRRFRTKLIKYKKLLDASVWTQAIYAEHIMPLCSFVAHANEKVFLRSCLTGGDRGVERTV